MKYFRRALWGGVIVFALFLIFSWFWRRQWSQDWDSLKFRTGAGVELSARRDSVSGVWSIEVPDEKSLAFAFGYLQMLDREFQIELMRHLALGQATRWFGEKLLPHDRMGRFFARTARKEWEHARPELKAFLTAYVEGILSYRKEHAKRLPLEYEIFQLKPEEFPAWEPWQVLAIARFHTWEFSYDFRSESRSERIAHQRGSSWRDFLFPAESPDSEEVLYLQPGVRDHIKTEHRSGRSVERPFWKPQEMAALLFPILQSPSKRHVGVPQLFEKGFPVFPGEWLGAELGASNLWITQVSRQAPAELCNDTHLSFSWPSPLYPLRYQMGDTLGQGFSLPGTPGLVMGRVEDTHTQLSWGITIANYADTQDLVELSPDTLKNSVTFSETFMVRDFSTGKFTEKSYEESWTPWGPRVDSILSDSGEDWAQSRRLALDWMGFRQASAPVDFYRRRSLLGARDLEKDLEERWDYPSVNFAWIKSVGSQMEAGHVVTGIIFQQTGRSRPGVLSEKRARQRALSGVKDRPHFVQVLSAPKQDGVGDSVFLTSANQAVYPEKLGKSLGWEWGGRVRTRRILDLRSQLKKNPEQGQGDVVSLGLKHFYQRARREVSVDRLCAEGEAAERDLCRRWVAHLDEWKGAMSLRSSAPTFIAGWYMRVLWRLWSPQENLAETEIKNFLAWQKSTSSHRLLGRIMNAEGPERRAWVQLTEKDFGDLLVESFRTNLENLVQERGPAVNQWNWEQVHGINWLHPLKKIPGLMGTSLAQALLGPPPPVPGSFDSPSRFDFVWDPREPTHFPSEHGAAMRFCSRMFPESPTEMKWTLSTGVSGHPLSKWAWAFAEEGYFQNRLLE